ncbi:hypothetical protein [Ornithinibacillus sp. FSL M8-0202]|uniref:hypothetical protein n=1 Tax=Ornithinibacillus sp. FSL M8-0202 TaxID=2921616 RepID=UPI0030CF7DD9
MSVEITVIIAILGLIISFQAYQLNKDKRQSDKVKGVKQEANQDAEVRTQLNYISRGVDDIRIDLKANEKQIAQHSERITRVEESAKQAHKRIDALED